MGWPKVAFKFTAQKNGLINLRYKPPQNVEFKENPNEYTTAEKSAVLFLRAILDLADAFNERVLNGTTDNGPAKEDGDNGGGGH